MPQPRILVIGSSNTDIVSRVTTIPQPGQTVLSHDYFLAQGGKGANQAVAAARLGAQVTFLACLGMDAYGDQALEALQKEGVDTHYILRDPRTNSGLAMIMVSDDAENIIAVTPGANACLLPEHLVGMESVMQQADCLLLQFEIPLITVQAAIAMAKENNLRVILNPAPAQTIPGEYLSAADILTPNQSEAALLSGSPVNTTNNSLLEVREHLGCRTMVVTCGASGACIVEEQIQRIPAPSVQAVDTTASGDAFNAGLAVALSNGETLQDAVRYAIAVGSLTVTKPGAQPSLPTQTEVAEFIAQTE